jgi:hypothetical protein
MSAVTMYRPTCSVRRPARRKVPPALRRLLDELLSEAGGMTGAPAAEGVIPDAQQGHQASG